MASSTNYMELIPAYLAGELEPHEAAEFESHLAADEECQKALAKAQKTDKAIRALIRETHLPPDPVFEERVCALAHDESQKMIENLPPDIRTRAERRRAQREAALEAAQAGGRQALLWFFVVVALLTGLGLVLVRFF